MKKVLPILSFASFLTFLGLTSQSESIVVPGAEKALQKNYIVTVAGEPEEEAGLRRKNQVLSELACEVSSKLYSIDYVYEHVYNGFSITTSEEVAKVIETIPGVVSVNQQATYEKASDETGTSSGYLSDADTTVTEMMLGNYSAETMNATAEDINAVLGGGQTAKRGEGVLIAVIDDGLKLNQVEGTAERAAAESRLSASNLQPAAFKDLDALSLKLSQQEAAETINRVGHGAWINNKIPFARDYAGNDNDVNAYVEDSNHGTHVASLATANGDSFQGIAPNAQLAMLKVGNDSDGSLTGSIIAAIDDAWSIGADVVNISIGSSITETQDTSLTGALERAAAHGLIVNYAASNDGKGSYSSQRGYSGWTTDTMNTSMLSSQSTQDEGTNVVASTNPDKAFYSSIMLVDGQAVSYEDQVYNRENSTLNYDEEHRLVDLLGENSQGTFKFARILGYGNRSDYDAFYQANGVSNLSGYVAVVDRGTTTFAEKANFAIQSQADALIVINNEPSLMFNMYMDFGALENPSIPIVFVFQSMRDLFTAYGSDGAEVVGHTGEFTLASNQVVESPDGNTPSSFTSDGVPYNLDISPTVAAPGYNIAGAYDATQVGTNTGIYGYENMSGTSMATPNFTGSLATVLSEYVPGSGNRALTSDEEYAELKAKLSKIAMSTADQVHGTNNGVDASVRLQGSGRVNVASMLETESYITVQDPDDETRQDAKAELKNNGTLYTDLADASHEAYIEFNYTVHNDSNETRTYTPKLEVLIPMLEVQVTQSEFDDMEASSQEEISENLPNAITMAIDEDILDISDRQLSGTITVNAGSTATGSVRVRIDDIHFHKDFTAADENGNREVPSFDGTLREYFNTYFNGEGMAGGSFVEGYLYLIENEEGVNNDESSLSTLSIPYLGFYGDYTKGDAVEPFSFEKTQGRLYNSEMADAYLQNLSNLAKPNAYTGSTLSGVSASANLTNLQSTINTLSGSALPSARNNIVNVNDIADPTHLYAGATGRSDTIVAVLYVNRALVNARWTLTPNAGTAATQRSDIFTDICGYNATGAVELTRSVLFAVDDYTMHHGFASIPLSNLPEGDYTLTFTLPLKGFDTGTQVKEYTLTIDRTAPTFEGFEITSDEWGSQITVTANGANQYIGNRSYSVDPTLVAGTEDTYTATFALNDSDFTDEGRYYISLVDKAGNTTYAIIHLNVPNLFIHSADIDGTFDFYMIQTSASGGSYYYAFGLTNASTGADIAGGSYDVTVVAYIGKNVDVTGYSIMVQTGTKDEEEVDFTYNPDTGYITFVIEGYSDGGSVSSNFSLINSLPSETPEPEPGEDSSSSAPSEDSSSSAPSEDSSSSAPSGDSSTSAPVGDSSTGTVEPEPSEGLGGGAIAGIAIGSVGGVALVAFLVWFFVIRKK